MLVDNTYCLFYRYKYKKLSTVYICITTYIVYSNYILVNYKQWTTQQNKDENISQRNSGSHMVSISNTFFS